MSGLITEYLGSGTTAARPASLPLSPGAIGFYWSTDDSELSMWDGTAWAEDILAGSTFTGGSLTSALNEAKGADIASAATTDIGAATGNFVHVTGTTTITALGTVQAGTGRILRFAGSLLLTHNATSLILPTGANITTAANDCAVFVSEGSGNWRCVGYQRADGTALAGSGDVVGPASATADAVALFDGTTGKLLKNGETIASIRSIPQNSQSAAYTAVLADAGKHILHPSADTTARTFTIPANSSVAYPIGTALTFVNQNGAGVVTIAITTDTMRLAGAGTTGSRTLAANGIATALKITSTEWIISGTGLS